MVQAVVIDDPDDLESWVEPWDELAGTASRPFCSPAWMLPWWHQEAPPGACLRTIVVVDDDGSLVAIAPFFAHPAFGTLTRYRLLSSARGTPIEPLARPGRESEAASAIAERLSQAMPRPDLVTMEGATPGWAGRIWQAWPGPRRSSLHRDRWAFAPAIDLSGRVFEDWFSAKSRNFQQQMRGSERKLGREGFAAHVAGTPDEIERGLAALSTEHVQRWDKRGGSRVWRSGTPAMLREVQERLRPTDRFRLITIDDGTEVISAHLFVAAGRHISYWLGSFDERWAPYRPGMVALIAALRDAWQQGYDRVDFGQGNHQYKLRLADERQELEWVTLIPGGLSGLRTRMHLAPRRGARAVAGRLPETVRKRVRERLPR